MSSGVKPDTVKIGFWKALTLPVTIKRAARVAVLVGTVLIAINQGDNILLGDWPPFWKVILTYFVPYSVSSYSSAAFLSDLCRRNPLIPIKDLLQ